MTRKEHIEQMKEQISVKQKEILDLQSQIGKEMIADFYETHGLKEGQHFYYGDKKCAGVVMAAGSFFLKALPITSKGEVSKKGLIIYGDKSIKPIKNETDN